jgi:hypothetical protein
MSLRLWVREKQSIAGCLWRRENTRQPAPRGALSSFFKTDGHCNVANRVDWINCLRQRVLKEKGDEVQPGLCLPRALFEAARPAVPKVEDDGSIDCCTLDAAPRNASG